LSNEISLQPEIISGEFFTHSAEETFEFAYKIGESLTHSTVFLLAGDLGAGKTVFAKGIAAGLDIDPADVNSPTFTLINIHKGRMKLYHLDLYRLSGTTNEIYELGLDEMLAEENAVAIIEWSERLSTFSIPNAHRVNISELDPNSRKIVIYQKAEAPTQ
jgi:tRNA threonylcarbamoyladenosine biosynthesis protein TsaE